MDEQADLKIYKTMPDSEKVRLLRGAGCVCQQPLLGWRPMKGPRCRLCNIEAALEKNNGRSE